MVIVYRGFGVAVPILLAICAGGLSLLFTDTRLGNLDYVGWTFIIGGGLSVLPGLAALGDEERPWWHHSFFFLPIIVWSVGLVAGGIGMVLTYDGAADRIVGKWAYNGCVKTCPDGFDDRMQGLTLDIGEEEVRVGDGKPRAYEITKESENFVEWKYEDDGSFERNHLVGDDRFDGVITVGKSDVRVRFKRLKS